ncbi:olfactomedin-4-like [Silurus asotus]|uniref:Olfactomedin-4-like n=1 Tax=Silurus asotus TaxID=30991 RepID=A0AAD5AKN1_SILAS|nr:olfactomedin-4-like [Silurus asotus]
MEKFRHSQSLMMILLMLLLAVSTETSTKTVPEMEVMLQNMTERLEKYQYLNTQGLYNALHLKQLSQEIQQLHDTMSNVQTSKGEAQQIRTELQKFQEDVNKMYKKNIFNLETTREKLRSLSNRVQTCRTIPQDFRTNGHRQGSLVRFYKTYEDFMAGRNHRDETLVSSYTHANAIQGPGTIVYKNMVYYQCYNTPEICAFDLKTKQFQRLALPDAGFNNKFPYCYYNCLDWTDINLSGDDKGLWVIYATEANHGNLVVSRVDFDDFNVTHTWKTRLFKRSVTNAFMVCGVLYATRFINTYKEEVFYAFDTTTGAEDNMLSLPMEKVAAGVANLHFNPLDTKLYMYNGGYMLAYQAYF